MSTETKLGSDLTEKMLDKDDTRVLDTGPWLLPDGKQLGG